MKSVDRIYTYFNFGRQALKTKDGKALAENFAYLSILQVAGYILPFITIPYLSRVIGVDGFGKIAFASAIIAWVQTFVDWGFGYSATRDVARNRENKEALTHIYSNVMWAKCFLSLISFIILALLTIVIPMLRENALLMLFTYLLIPGYVLFPDWFFQGMEKMKYTTLFNIGVKIAFTIAIFFVIKVKDDYIYQPLLTSLGYIVSGVLACFLIRKKWGVSLQRPNIKIIGQYLKGSFDIFLGNLFPTMYSNFSVVLLGALGSPKANGLFDGGNKFVNVAQQFMSVIGKTFYPFLNRRSDKFSLYARLNLSVSFIISLLLFIFAPLIVHIFLTPEFEGSITVLRIMSVSIFFLSLCTVYQLNYLFVNGYDRVARNITIIASIIGFLLAYPMIKWYGYIGVALNVAIARGIMGILNMVVAKKYMKK